MVVSMVCLVASVKWVLTVVDSVANQNYFLPRSVQPRCFKDEKSGCTVGDSVVVFCNVLWFRIF